MSSMKPRCPDEIGDSDTLNDGEDRLSRNSGLF